MRRHSVRVDQLQQQIRRKEAMAEDARQKGMQTTWSNYKSDIAVLKTQLHRELTAPTRYV